MSTTLAPSNGNGVMTPTTKLKTFQAYFEARKSALAAIVPKTLTPDRVLKIAIAAVARTPKLLECKPESVYAAVHSAAQLGLEAGSPLGHAYLVPYKDQCQLILGYRGLIDLARRSGQIVSIEAHVVHKADEYEVEFGIEPKLRHKPFLSGDPGEMVMVYSVAKLKDGGVQTDVMTRNDVDKIRARSRASSSGPWVTDYEEMARKTVVRRLCKYLPISIEAADAIAAEDERENGNASAQILPSVEVISSEVAPESKADDIANRLTNNDAPALTNDGPTVTELIDKAEWLTSMQKKGAKKMAESAKIAPSALADLMSAASESEDPAAKLVEFLSATPPPKA